MTTSPTAAEAFFRWVITHPRKLLLACGLLVALGASGLGDLHKDTRSDAFIPPGDPALEAREQVREVFGLSDPIVVAVVAAPDQEIFTPETLRLVEWLNDRLAELPGIDGANVRSLASSDRIEGDADALHIDPFFEDAPTTARESRAVRDDVLAMPLYRGSLVSEDAGVTLLVAELDDRFDAGETYAAVVRLSQEAPIRAGEVLHVAGEGGVAGHLGDYIDADTRRMLPAALLAVTMMLFAAYRTPRGLMLPNMIVVGGVAIAMGSLAASGAPYTLITPALPVILVAIGVADGIHILGQYYRELDRDPHAPAGELVVRAMVEVVRPLTVTSLTDAAGFLALAASTDMPPFQAFGFFAAVGVLAMYGLSIVAMPAALSLMTPRPSRAVSRKEEARRPSRVEALLRVAGPRLVRFAPIVVMTSVGVAGVGLSLASDLAIDYERVRNFRHDEPIRQADRAINDRTAGINYLDVLIEADEEGALLEPATLRRIESFEREVEALPGVGRATSIIDYLTTMNRALHAGDEAARRLPETRAAAAQLAFLYDMEGSDAAIRRTLDADDQRALVRIALPSGRYSEEARVVAAVEGAIARHLDDGALETSLAGRVNVDVRWMQGLERTHFLSVGVALLAVFLVSALSFRSVVAGLLTTLPVLFAVLTIYAVMSLLGLWLGITTSMFAALAIGLGVDFSVHSLERIRRNARQDGLTLEEAVLEGLPTVGRELVFNFACAGFGFGVLALSQVPTLVEFGLLTLTAVSASFVGGLVLLPALVLVIRPRCLARPAKTLHVIRHEPICAPVLEADPVIGSSQCLAPAKTGRSSSSASRMTMPSL